MEDNNKETTNYAEYTYEKESDVVIKGSVFNMINMVLNKMNEDEVKVYFKYNNKDGGFDDKPTMFSTEKGMTISHVLELIYHEHVKNVESGVAIKMEELQRPKISVE